MDPVKYGNELKTLMHDLCSILSRESKSLWLERSAYPWISRGYTWTTKSIMLTSRRYGFLHCDEFGGKGGKS